VLYRHAFSQHPHYALRLFVACHYLSLSTHLAAAFACRIGPPQAHQPLTPTPITVNTRQAFQTATAGVLALYLSKFLGLPEGYWAAITAMIVLQATLGAALKESGVRVAATAIGAVVAIPFTTFLGRGLLAFGVAVFATVLVCSLLRLTAGLRVAATTVAIIMLVPHSGRLWAPGIHRFLEVSLGIVVALLVSKFVWPSSALEDLRTGLAATCQQLDSLFIALAKRCRGEAHDDIEGWHIAVTASSRHNEDLRAQACYEVSFRPKSPKFLAAMAEHVEHIHRALCALDVASSGAGGHGLAPQIQPEFGDLCAGIDACLVQIYQGLSGKLFAPVEFDLPSAAQALEVKVAQIHTGPRFAELPVQEALRLDAVCLAMKALSVELEKTQVTARAGKL
jgi:Fusaric acid resistance protein family